MTRGKLMSMREIADYIGLTYRSVRDHHNTAEKHRRENAPRPGDMPQPDQIVSRSPAWYTDTIDRWRASMPGKGTGGGRRPRKPAQ